MTKCERLKDSFLYYSLQPWIEDSDRDCVSEYAKGGDQPSSWYADFASSADYVAKNINLLVDKKETICEF